MVSGRLFTYAGASGGWWAGDYLGMITGGAKNVVGGGPRKNLRGGLTVKASFPDGVVLSPPPAGGRGAPTLRFRCMKQIKQAKSLGDFGIPGGDGIRGEDNDVGRPGVMRGLNAVGVV